jgi:hypothetical protein
MSDPRIPAALRDEPVPATADPLHHCIVATVALLTWLVGPAAVALFGGIAAVAYARAWRRGLRVSRCYLRDVRLVVGYLVVVTAVAATAVVR